LVGVFQCNGADVAWRRRRMEEKPTTPPGESYYEQRIFRAKGHKHERERPAFLANIEAKMKEMPKLIEEWRKERAKLRYKTPLQKLLEVKANKR